MSWRRDMLDALDEVEAAVDRMTPVERIEVEAAVLCMCSAAMRRRPDLRRMTREEHLAYAAEMDARAEITADPNHAAIVRALATFARAAAEEQI